MPPCGFCLFPVLSYWWLSGFFTRLWSDPSNFCSIGPLLPSKATLSEEDLTPTEYRAISWELRLRTCLNYGHETPKGQAVRCPRCRLVPSVTFEKPIELLTPEGFALFRDQEVQIMCKEPVRRALAKL